MDLTWQQKQERQIAVRYQDNRISDLAEEILFEHGIDVRSDFSPEVFKDELIEIDGIEHFIEIWLRFVKLSLPDLVLEEASYKRSELKTIPPINGWWNDNLNVQFGYGLFY